MRFVLLAVSLVALTACSSEPEKPVEASQPGGTRGRATLDMTHTVLFVPDLEVADRVPLDRLGDAFQFASEAVLDSSVQSLMEDMTARRKVDVAIVDPRSRAATKEAFNAIPLPAAPCRAVFRFAPESWTLRPCEHGELGSGGVLLPEGCVVGSLRFRSVTAFVGENGPSKPGDVLVDVLRSSEDANRATAFLVALDAYLDRRAHGWIVVGGRGGAGLTPPWQGSRAATEADRQKMIEEERAEARRVWP
ncbi:MAG TPA: hypothetical protein VFF73_03530 [Planctomycetota bacterium]|nr:hypothetical protein [Planctomycetota bacterium]